MRLWAEQETRLAAAAAAEEAATVAAKMAARLVAEQAEREKAAHLIAAELAADQAKRAATDTWVHLRLRLRVCINDAARRPRTCYMAAGPYVRDVKLTHCSDTASYASVDLE